METQAAKPIVLSKTVYIHGNTWLESKPHLSLLLVKGQTSNTSAEKGFKKGMIIVNNCYRNMHGSYFQSTSSLRP